MYLLGFGAGENGLVAGREPGATGNEWWFLSAPSTRVEFVPVPPG